MPSPLSPTDAMNHYWTAEVNDLIGGYIVTNCKKPASQVDITPESEDYVIADCPMEQDAIIIASCLNRAGVKR